MAAGFPVKQNYAAGDILTAAQMNDLSSTLNYLDPTAKGDLFPASSGTALTRLAVGNNGETLVADSSTSTGLRYQAPKVANAVYNSSFDVWQRGTSFTGAAPYYSADRWVAVRQGGASGSTYSRQSAGLTGFTYSLRAQRDSGNTSTNVLQVGQSLETADSVRFAGKTVTFSFYAKAGANYSATSSVLGARVDSGTGTDQQYWVSGFTGAANVASSNVTLTTSWQRFSITGTVSSSATEISFGFAAAVTGTAGANDWFEITGLQLEEGSVATPYNRMSGTIQGELAACQRYYARYANEAANNILVSSSNYNTTQAYSVLSYPVQMRISPTISVSAAGNFTVYVNNTSTVPSGFSSGEITTKAARLLWTCSGLTTGHAGFIQNNTASAYLEASAEL